MPQPLDSLWRVRRTDGSSHQLPSLADLTRLISEGTFTRDDEVSRTGKAWRRLGDIEELEGFFAEADRRGPSRARKATQGPIVGLEVAKPGDPEGSSPVRVDATPTVQVANAARPADVNESFHSHVAAANANDSMRSHPPRPNPSPAAISGDNVPTQPLPVRPAEPARAIVEATRALEPVIARPADEDEIATEQRPLPPRSAAISGDPLALPKRRPSGEFARAMPLSPSAADDAATTGRLPLTDLGERSPEDAPKTRKPLWLWLFAAVSTGLAVSIWLLWPMPPLQGHGTTKIVDPSVQFLARADEAFATQRIDHFEQAITEYTKALAFHESDPHILSSLSRVYAVWAQEIRYQTQAAERDRDKSKDARSAAVSADASQVEQLAEKAKWYAEAAARKNPGNGEAEVALSDALRLTNNLVGARSELDHELATDKDPSAETLRVAALLAIDEAGGDARAGLSRASQAVAKEPELIRTQLLLARCLVGDGDLVGARYHLRAVTTRDRDHPSALAVEAWMSRPSDNNSARDASVDDKGKDNKDKDKDKAATDEPPAQYDNLSHEAYITRGQAMLEAGQVSGAKRMFEQALFIRPSSSQAHTGLGYVALEKGRPQLAAEHFLAATRAGNDEALIGLGDAYRRMSRPRDALRAYQNYLAHNPNGRQVTIARAQVERLSEDVQAKKTP
ncbi:MAG TPA: tetratricopeptide repeat protein [Polyangiales bacterium]|nr:tetratricopeptide repeat protein [Polyangiales bacterium]